MKMKRDCVRAGLAMVFAWGVAGVAVPAAGAVPSGLGDEFDDPASISQWTRRTVAEQWNADQLKTWDIGISSPGAMTMVPYASVWYEDYAGAFAFKEVTGDFVVTTRLTVRDTDAGDADDIPGRQFDLAGLLARAPRDITPATWTTGGENYVFVALGNGQRPNESFQVEAKTTQDSVSDLELRDVPAGAGLLQIARIGDAFVTLYRPDGGEWSVFRRHDRPDLPDTLQVGMHAYTDWETAGAMDPFAHNGSVVQDFPAGDGFPDLRAEFDWIRFADPLVPGALAGLDLADPGQVSDELLLSFLGAGAVPAPVPEPRTWALFVVGGLGLLASTRRRRTAGVLRR